MEDIKELIWFKVEDILPKKGVYVLVRLIPELSRAEYDECAYIGGKVVDDSVYGYIWRTDVGLAFRPDEITHWAYIPEPST